MLSEHRCRLLRLSLVPPFSHPGGGGCVFASARSATSPSTSTCRSNFPAPMSSQLCARERGAREHPALPRSRPEVRVRRKGNACAAIPTPTWVASTIHMWPGGPGCTDGGARPTHLAQVNPPSGPRRASCEQRPQQEQAQACLGMGESPRRP